MESALTTSPSSALASSIARPDLPAVVGPTTAITCMTLSLPRLPVSDEVADLEGGARILQGAGEGGAGRRGRPGQDLPGGAAGYEQVGVLGWVKVCEPGRTGSGQRGGDPLVVAVRFRVGSARGLPGAASRTVAHRQDGDGRGALGDLLA